ncbi:hypothetical protein BKA83DRAFT_4381237 [Pisolithus microcarpus]|nr:hypothetical protein BKA83DRAFT_4381237 [Pisolithus microcarpus]
MRCPIPWTAYLFHSFARLLVCICIRSSRVCARCLRVSFSLSRSRIRTCIIVVLWMSRFSNVAILYISHTYGRLRT